MALRDWKPSDAVGVRVIEFDPSIGGNIDVVGGLVTALRSSDGALVAKPTTDAERPVYNATGINGGPSIKFYNNGTPNRLKTQAFNQGPTWAVFAVIKQGENTGTQSIIDADNYNSGTGNRVAQYLRFDGTNLQSIGFTPAVSVVAPSVSQGSNGTVKVVGARLVGRTVQIAVDGGAPVSATLNADPIAASAVLTLGSWTANNANFRGDSAIWYLAQGDLSDADWDRFFGQLGARYNKLGDYPSSHPYKNARPQIDDGAGAADSRNGASTGSAIGSATGIGRRAASGASYDAAVGSADAAGRKGAQGASQATALASAAGTGFRPSSAAGTGEASGIGTASGTGSVARSGRGTAGAIASGAGVGEAARSGAATALAFSSGTARGDVSRRGAGTASAVGSAAGTGATARRGVSTASATSTAFGNGVASQEGAGSSTASATGKAEGSGRKTDRGTGTAGALGAAGGIGRKSASGKGLAGATASASGTGRVSRSAQGESTASAVAQAIPAGRKSARGSGTVSAIGRTAGSGRPASAGTGRAAASLVVRGIGRKAARGVGAARAVGRTNGDRFIPIVPITLPEAVRLKGKRTAPVSLRGMRQGPARLKGGI